MIIKLLFDFVVNQSIGLYFISTHIHFEPKVHLKYHPKYVREIVLYSLSLKFPSV